MPIAMTPHVRVRTYTCSPLVRAFTGLFIPPLPGYSNAKHDTADEGGESYEKQIEKRQSKNAKSPSCLVKPETSDDQSVD